MSRNRLLVLALALGAMLRVVYFFTSQHLPFFEFPITDALYHHRLAQAIASGWVWDGEAFFRAPFYYYLLGALYALFGPHVIVGKVLGHLAGLVTGALIIAWSDRLWGRRGALWAALLWLGSGFLLFYEGELLVDSVFTCLLFASLYVQSAGTGRGSHQALSGALFGLAAITRPTAFVCLPVVIYRALRERPRTRALWPWLGACAVPVAVVAGLNTYALGRPAGLATSGGINFYIGNHLGADGGSATLPEPWGYAWSYRSVSDHASEVAGRALDAGEVSDYYYDLGLRFWLDHPGEAFDLFVRKAVMSVGRVRLSDNLSLPWVTDRLVLLRLLFVWVAPLFIVAAAGLPCLGRAPGDARWLWGVVASYLAVLVVFFTTDRFRLPLVPLFIVLAAGTPGLLRAAANSRRVQGAALAALALVVALPNWYGASGAPALAWFNLGNVALRQGATREAITYYDSALASGSALRQLRLNRGWAYFRSGAHAEARRDFEAEARAFPGDARPFNNLAALSLVEGDTVRARAFIDSGLVRDSTLAVLYLQGLRVAAAEADTAAMRVYLESAARHGRAWPVWAYWRAELELLRGRPEAARGYLADYSRRWLWPTLDLEDEAVSGPSAAQVDYSLGLSYLSQQRIDSAAAYFERAALADSSLAEAWSNWGTAAVAQGDFESAQARYRVALSTRPRSPVFLTNLAWAQLALGLEDSARTNLVRALAVDSAFPPAVSLLRQLEPGP